MIILIIIIIILIKIIVLYGMKTIQNVHICQW